MYTLSLLLIACIYLINLAILAIEGEIAKSCECKKLDAKSTDDVMQLKLRLQLVLFFDICVRSESMTTIRCTALYSIIHQKGIPDSFWA